jgi:hypothetical protein
VFFRGSIKLTAVTLLRLSLNVKTYFAPFLTFLVIPSPISDSSVRWPDTCNCGAAQGLHPIYFQNEKT